MPSLDMGERKSSWRCLKSAPLQSALGDAAVRVLGCTYNYVLHSFCIADEQIS